MKTMTLARNVDRSTTSAGAGDRSTTSAGEGDRSTTSAGTGDRSTTSAGAGDMTFGGGFFLACEDFGKMFDQSFTACALKKIRRED